MKKNFIFLIVFAYSLCHIFSIYASGIPKNGYDWNAMPKSEKVSYCGILVYNMVGVGNTQYTSSRIKNAAYYFAGRINYYYKNKPLETPIEKAAAWAWPETLKLLNN